MAVPFAAGPLVWSDDFSYSDGQLSTVGSAAWGAPLYTAQSSLDVLSGEIKTATDGTWEDGYTLDAAHADGDFIAHLNGLGDAASTRQLLFHTRAKHEGEAGVDAYTFNLTRRTDGDSRVRLHRWDNGVASIVGGLDVNPITVAATDRIGIRAEGSSLGLWLFNGTSWSQVGTTQTDATYASGRIAIETNGVGYRVTMVEKRALFGPGRAPVVAGQAVNRAATF